MTNVYFKKENDIILNGTLWKEVENKFMPRASLANHQKHSAASVRAGPGRASWASPDALSTCQPPTVCLPADYLL